MRPTPDTGTRVVTTNKTGQYVPVKAKAKAADYNLVHLLQQAGFKGPALSTMYRIVMAESGGRANAFNGNARTGDRSYGLAQINMLGQMGVNRAKQYGLKSYDQLFDPLTNLRAAYRISNGGTNFNPWTTYTSGRYSARAFDPNYSVTNVGQGAPGASGNFTPYSYSGASGSGTSGTGGTGAMSSLPPAPSLGKFLGADVIYQDQLAASQKQLSQYLANVQKQKATELATYGQKVHGLQDINKQNQIGTLNNYGSRGIAHSSLYGDALTSLAKQYAQDKTGLDTENTQFLQNLAAGTQSFRDQQLNAQQAAMAAAAARRAAIYGASAGARLGGSAIGGTNPNVRVG